MAHSSLLNIPVPDEFSFNAVEWNGWFSRFERFRQVSQLSEKDESLQVSTLLYVMGPKAEELLESLKLSDSDLKKYSTVTEKLTNFFIPKKNVVFERAKFNMRIQKQGEPVDSFISDLHHLASSCEYGSLKEELIRDRIVIGLLDRKLSEQLQLDDELTLEKATNKAMQSALVRKQQNTIHNNPEVSFVDKNKFKHNNKSNQTKKEYANQNNGNKDKQVSENCLKCGKIHVKQKCPAYNLKCYRCGGFNHFPVRPFKLCKPLKTNFEKNKRTDNSFSNKNIGFIGLLDCTKSTEPWMLDVLVNDCVNVSFCIDTGACISALPESLYTQNMGVLNYDFSENVSGPNGENLKILGKLDTKLSYNDSSCITTLYIIENLSRPLLGRSVIEPLNILKRVVNNVSPPDVSVNKIDWTKKFPQLFSGLGLMSGSYSITLKENAVPFSVHLPRRVPLPLLDKVKDQLRLMVDNDVIEEITEPTPWCAPIVVVPKSDGSVRITTDFTKLNQSIVRERFEMPGVDYTLAQLGNSKYFTKLDFNSGFFQLKLDDNSKKLTCFITPFGRFVYKRLPQGASPSPEVFSKKMSSILSGLEGCISMVDDICVHAPTLQMHNERLTAVLKRLQEQNVTLNAEKCQFAMTTFKYLGYVIDGENIYPDPKKVSAISDFPSPKNLTEVRRWLGLLNQLTKFIPNVSHETKPIRSLLQKDKIFDWGPEQEECFNRLKKLLLSADVLCHYDCANETKIHADASAYGLGAIIYQKINGIWRPLAYASRSLTDVESRWAVIEKEMLAITFACSRFRDYIVGLPSLEIWTDHSPLVSLLNHKNIDELPIRLQRLRLRIAGLPFIVKYIKGSEQTSADCLSRAPLKTINSSDIELHSVVDDYVVGFIKSFPASDEKLKLIIQKQKEDSTLSKIRKYCEFGWPNASKLSISEKPFNSVSSELTIIKDILCKSNRIVVPDSLRVEMLDRIHEGHQGITKSLERLRSALWWPNCSSQVKDRISKCEVCCRSIVNRAEPLIVGDFPNRPWEKIGVDLFFLNNKNYLIIVDYYSRWIETPLLTSTSSESVITQLKSIFSKYGIVDYLISDNGPQFSSYAFSEFAKNYGFTHVTSSPNYPQSNGEAERAVQLVKNMLKKCIESNGDPYLSLLSYRSTPLKNGYSPAELLMGRKLKTRLPILPSKLEPKLPDFSKLYKSEQKLRNYNKNYTDKHRGAQFLPELKRGQKVFVKREGIEGEIVKNYSTPRSYVIKNKDGAYLRRNRRCITILPNVDKVQKETVGSSVSETQEVQRRISDRSTKGKKPLRYHDEFRT